MPDGGGYSSIFLGKCICVLCVRLCKPSHNDGLSCFPLYWIKPELWNCFASVARQPCSWCAPPKRWCDRHSIMDSALLPTPVGYLPPNLALKFSVCHWGHPFFFDLTRPPTLISPVGDNPAHVSYGGGCHQREGHRRTPDRLLELLLPGQQVRARADFAFLSLQYFWFPAHRPLCVLGATTCQQKHLGMQRRKANACGT